MAWRLRRLQRGILAGLLALVLGAPLPGAASTILLSQASSDETPVEAIFAELRFAVTGTVLELTVLNRTDESNVQFGTGEYKINEIFFNATSNVTGLTLVSPSGWSLETNQRGGGEFGRFDFALIGDEGQSPNQIDAGASLTFEFDISGTGPFAMEDFATEKSTTPPGSMPVLAQAKFVQGIDDDSAFGGSSFVVSEPGATLLVAGCLLAARRRLRRKLSPPRPPRA